MRRRLSVSVSLSLSLHWGLSHLLFLQSYKTGSLGQHDHYKGSDMRCAQTRLVLLALAALAATAAKAEEAEPEGEVPVQFKTSTWC